MKRYVIRELYPNGTKVLVSQMCEVGEFELLFNDVFKANELMQKCKKARPDSKFKVILLDIEE